MADDRLRVALLGATGSIGRSTIDVIEARPERYRLVAVSARGDVDGLASIARRHRLEAVGVSDSRAAVPLADLLGETVDIHAGEDAASRIAAHGGLDRVVNGIVGAAGLAATLAALEAGTDVALANKESMVLAGELVTRTARESGAKILPIDSEHASLLRCLWGRDPRSVRDVVLTASGGPFRTLSSDALARVTPAEALRHPTWKMGRRITVDSATLMNKGFEVIEARWLFGLEPERIRVLVHPTSIVHAMVTLADGSVIAHLAPPDMRLPIELALSHPDEPPARFEPLDLLAAGPLVFEAPDRDRFPCLGLAERALSEGGTMPAVLNAADEVAVDAFLAGEIAFPEIAGVVGETMERHSPRAPDTLDVVLDTDRWARDQASSAVSRRRTKERTTCPDS